jgi:hypothetical protein
MLVSDGTLQLGRASLTHLAIPMTQSAPVRTSWRFTEPARISIDSKHLAVHGAASGDTSNGK